MNINAIDNLGALSVSDCTSNPARTFSTITEAYKIATQLVNMYEYFNDLCGEGLIVLRPDDTEVTRFDVLLEEALGL